MQSYEHVGKKALFFFLVGKLFIEVLSFQETSPALKNTWLHAYHYNHNSPLKSFMEFEFDFIYVFGCRYSYILKIDLYLTLCVWMKSSLTFCDKFQNLDMHLPSFVHIGTLLFAAACQTRAVTSHSEAQRQVLYLIKYVYIEGKIE